MCEKLVDTTSATVILRGSSWRQTFIEQALGQRSDAPLKPARAEFVIRFPQRAPWLFYPFCQPLNGHRPQAFAVHSVPSSLPFYFSFWEKVAQHESTVLSPRFY